MQKIKAIIAILTALILGVAASTFMPGCQPPEGERERSSSLTTGSEKPSHPAAAEQKASPEATGETSAEKPSADQPSEEKKSDESTEEKPAQPQPAAESKPAEETSSASQPTSAPAGASAKTTGEIGALKPTEWNQWGGSGLRNNVPPVAGVATQWNPGKFDRRTGAWNKEAAENIKWVANLGSQTYGNPVVASGMVFVGTNNSFGYLKRYPSDIDLGCLIAFRESDGKFLWQHSSEKLPTGRVHDWPLMGICCSPLVEGDRLWFVTSRGEVRCLDVDGFYDGTDDGRPEKEEPAKLFDMMRAEDPAEDKVGPLVEALDQGKLPPELHARFAKAGMELPADAVVTSDPSAKAPAKKWTIRAKVGDSERDLFITLAGPRLSGFKIVTPDDTEEADVIWVFDMMKNLRTSQHNMCSCSVTALGDILFVNTSNGLDEQHTTAPNPEAPSFVAMNKNTGQVYWTDNSPGINILHGQWSSPAVAVIGGVPQVIFGAGDGWMYGFKANEGKDGKPELLWKFDANPKKAILELGGRGTKNDIISTPVLYKERVYFATGQDPEHGEGVGILWCIDPTKRGDISESIVVNRADPNTPIPHKRIQSCVEAEGDVEKPNPNSGVVWKYMQYDNDGNGEIDEFMETFHRSISTVAIKDDLLFVPDFSGLFHCVDANDGKVYWTYDMLAETWGSPLIAGNYVYIGDGDGDVAVFEVKKERHDPIAEINMTNSVLSTPIVANGVLYIANRDHLFAIQEPRETTAGGEQ
jgi:outer membrane protein assembly factor BamB